jgi:putative endonuclease
MSRKEKGIKGENAAAGYLIENQCTILKKNYFTKYGEIDIIFKDGDTLVFAEVKYRTGERFGKPAESVTSGKIKRISLSALQYLYENNLLDAKCRFDVIEVMGQDLRIRQIKNAFEARLE